MSQSAGKKSARGGSGTSVAKTQPIAKRNAKQDEPSSSDDEELSAHQSEMEATQLVESSQAVGDDDYDMNDLDDSGDIDIDAAEELIASETARRAPKRGRDENVDESQEVKRANAPSARLNQVKAAPPAASASGSSSSSDTTVAVAQQNPAIKSLPPIVSMGSAVANDDSTIFGIMRNIGTRRILTAAAESTFSQVNYYPVSTTNAKHLALYTECRRRLASRKEADKVVGLMRAFRAGPLRVAAPTILRPFGILGDMTQAKNGGPLWAERQRLFALAYTNEAKDAVEDPPRQLPDRKFVRVPSWAEISKQTVEECKKFCIHHFGCIYDGDEFGIAPIKDVCLAEVLAEIAQENPGAQINAVAKAATTLDSADEKASIKLASGETWTIATPEVNKRVRERFIRKCNAPFGADSPDENVRKRTHWMDGTVIRAQQKVFRKMDDDELEQAKTIQPGETRAVYKSWPVDRPVPTKEDFDNPAKVDEVMWYIHSEGYECSKVRYIDQTGKPYVVPPQKEIVTEEGNASNESEQQEFTQVAAESTASSSSAIVAPTTIGGDIAPVPFVFKKPKRDPIVLPYGSIVAAFLRFRFFQTQPNKNNLLGSVGAHIDFTPTIVVIDRRQTKNTAENYDIESMYGEIISESEYAVSLQQMSNEEYTLMAGYGH
jgi:hypothetical protein